MKTKWTLLVAASTLTIASAALARGGHADRGGRLSHLDQNGDGKVTLAEATAATDKHFAELDQNRDGAVTQEEARQAMQAKKQKKADERFAERDANKDGKLSRSEVPGMSAERFQKIDANKDGFLTREEFKAAKGNHGAGPHDRGKRGGHFFSRVDQNGDGKVTRAEATAAVKALFEKQDKNRDGVLTGDELGKGHGGKHSGDCGRGEGKKQRS